jgi:signal transduction histidine kinase
MMFIDINTNFQKSKLPIINPAAISLVNSCAKDLFQDSYLDNFGDTLESLIQSMKGKRGASHSDVLHTMLRNKEKSSEVVYQVEAIIIELSDEQRVLGMIFFDISKILEERFKALEDFKGSLMSALSHELNNPMNSLIPLLRMMPHCYDNDTHEDIKAMALSSAFILQNKIQDLIDYSKIETGNMRLELTEFSVEELFDELKEIFRIEAEQKNNELVFDIKSLSNRHFMILADRARVNQVLIKLISNANKFTAKGRIIVMAEENKGNFNVRFSVSDTGIGISKKSKEFLFAPLHQKNWNTSVFAKLPGLGLEIANGICNCMECKLDVLSEENKGSTFSFTIPTCKITTFIDVGDPKIFIRKASRTSSIASDICTFTSHFRL